MPQQPEDLLLVGRVVRPHGVQGEIKVAPETDDLAHLDGVKRLHVGRTPEAAVPHLVEGIRQQTTKRGPLALVKFEGIDTRTDAEALAKLAVYAAEEELPPLAEGEAFLHDLIGLDVITEAGASVGTVREVRRSAAHALYVVERAEDGEEDELLIPAVEAFIAEVDLDAGRLVIRPIEGLLD